MNRLGLLVAVILAGAPFGAGCGDSDGASDAGLDATLASDAGDAGPAGPDTGTPTVIPPTATSITCGTATCMPTAGQAMLGSMSCCRGTNMDECGLMTALLPGGCMELGQPGGIDPTCPTYDVMGLGFLVWPGCCTPAGTCGALDSSMDGLGCIPSATLPATPDAGAPTEQTCTYDPNNTCTGLLPVECDGPEDCASGQFCCGEYEGGYVQLTCRDACSTMETPPDAGAVVDAGPGTGGIWSEICHAGQTCEVSGYTCSSNTDYLPAFLARCRDTMTQEAPASWSTTSGEINCGDALCGVGEKCCISTPEGAPYCADVGDACRCNASGNQGGDDGGAEDGG